MPEHNVSGYWKGLAVSRTFQVNVHLFLEHKGEAVTGQQETHHPDGRSSTGSVTGRVQGRDVTFNSEDKTIEFHGQLLGETSADFMLHGTMKTVKEKSPRTTLTLFPDGGGIIPFQYIPPPP